MKEGWKMVKLGEVCKIKGGSTPIKSNKLYWENGTIPWFTVDDIREQGRIIKYTNKNITELAAQKLCVYPVDTILLCCTASVGEYAITKIETTSNQQFNGLMIKDKSILSPEYLFHLVSTFKDVLLKLSGKTTIDFVSVSKVSDIEIPLPPLEEQHRIVSILDASFEKIDALKKNAEENLKNAKALFQQVLAQELKPKEGWMEKKLGEVADFVRGPFGGSLTKSIFKESGYAVYEQQHAIHHHVNIRYFIDENKFDEMKRFEVKPGDLIMSCSGTIGEVYIIPLDAPVGVINQALLKLSVSSQLDRCYFKSWLESPIFKEIILKYSKGAAIPNVPGVKILKDINIVLPPLEEQHRIVRTLDTLSEKCHRLEQVAQQTIRECDALKQSILRQAFSGKL